LFLPLTLEQRSQVNSLKQRLQAYGDYDEIKRELEIMKVSFHLGKKIDHVLIFSQYVEFAGAEDEEEDDDSVNGFDVQMPNPNAEKANIQQAKSLEALLALKNRRILDELAKFRVCPAPLAR
jgi:homeobox protein cut-like